MKKYVWIFILVMGCAFGWTFTESGAPYTVTVIKIFAGAVGLLAFILLIASRSPFLWLCVLGMLITAIGLKLLINHAGVGFLFLAVGLPMAIIGWAKLPKTIDIKLPSKNKPKKDPLGIR